MNLTIKIGILHLLLLLLPLGMIAQEQVDLLPGEYWWGGQTGSAAMMPFEEGYTADLGQNNNNQVQPLLISNKGRYVWHEEPFSFSFNEYQLLLNGPDGFVIGEAGASLADAYKYAAANFFPFTGKTPDPMLFTHPQYNTSIELKGQQNQASILAHAQSLIAQGFPPGVITIDDGWQRDYGDWGFRSDKFPDPKGMMDQLHKLGFKVMLWACPFVSPDSEKFRAFNKSEDGFLKDPLDPDEVKMVKWPNGYSALLDFTKPIAKYWLKDQLDYLKEEYGVDGFNMEGGDFQYYEDAVSDKAISPNEHSGLYAELALGYSVNQYRASWKMGGQALTQRLANKKVAWDDLETLVSNMTLQGIMGYPYACPGVIGGGEDGVLMAQQDSIDQELIVRVAQIQALMPMMQFSISPSGIVDGDHLAACNAAANLHAEFGKAIFKLAGQAAQTGEPIARSMEYAYPNTGQEFNRGQFMLGPDILVAPVITKGATKKEIWLPPGLWLANDGKAYQGNTTINVNAPLDVIPYFKRATAQKKVEGN